MCRPGHCTAPARDSAARGCRRWSALHSHLAQRLWALVLVTVGLGGQQTSLENIGHGITGVSKGESYDLQVHQLTGL